VGEIMGLVLPFMQRHADKISTTLSCFDRIVIQGTLPGICYADGMTNYLYAHEIRIFDYARFAEPLRDQIRDNAERLAKQHGMTITFVRNSRLRKEALVEDVLHSRGRHPGLVCILSAMEGCPTYKPWHDKQTHRTFLKSAQGQCLHYYFYFIDEKLGLCYVRVPTWCPFRLQVYFNGHNVLASQLQRAQIPFELRDNAFISVADPERAQPLADSLDVRKLHRLLDGFAQRFCPVIKTLGQSYHWSLMQVEYATDIVFKRQQDFAPLYEHLSRTAIHAVKPQHVATFLGRKLHGNFRDELGNDFSTRIEGTRIRHHMGPVAIKMYDKFSLVLRVETTANQVSFFQHHRKVEHRDGTSSYKLAPLKKSIYSLHDLRKLLHAANLRYLQLLADLDDPTVGSQALNKIATPVKHNGRSYRGFNFFCAQDEQLFVSLLRGEHTISGLRNKDIRRAIPHLSTGQISRHLKRLRTHGLIKRIGRTYKYYLTKLGQRVATLGLKLKHLYILPRLACSQPA
jgi:hypothetical protein